MRDRATTDSGEVRNLFEPTGETLAGKMARGIVSKALGTLAVIVIVAVAGTVVVARSNSMDLKGEKAATHAHAQKLELADKRITAVEAAVVQTSRAVGTIQGDIRAMKQEKIDNVQDENARLQKRVDRLEGRRSR